MVAPAHTLAESKDDGNSRAKTPSQRLNEKSCKADDLRKDAMRKALERSSDYTDLDGHSSRGKARRDVRALRKEVTKRSTILTHFLTSR